MMVNPVSFLALGFLSRDSHPQTGSGRSMAYYCRCSSLWLLSSSSLCSASFISLLKSGRERNEGGEQEGVRGKGEGRRKGPVIRLARSPARW